MPTAWLGRSRSSTRTASPGSRRGDSASRTRDSGRSSAPDPGLTLGGARPQVGKVEGVHPVPDLGKPLLALGVGLGEVAVLVRFGQDACLVEHLVGDKDTGAHPDRNRDRVRGPGIDLQAPPVDLGEDPRVEHLVAERRHDDPVDRDLDRAEEVGQEVMRDRPLRCDPGDLQRDRVRLVDADPDGEVAIRRLFLEDDDVLARRHVHPDAVDGHFHQVGHASIITPGVRRRGHLCPAATMARVARETLLLVDGHNLVYRAFHAMPALSNSRGEMTNAAYGFTSMLFKALNDTTPTYAIAAFDPPGPTFRHEKFAAYKAQRLRAPDELRVQFPWAREVVEALGIPIVEIPTFEADDVIGTLAQKAEAAGLDVIILTGDLDVLQLVTEHIRVFASRRGLSDTIIYDVDKVRERYGFEPPLVVDFKALQGDPSDNIPGVPGIGEKTAMSLVQQYGPLENVLEAVPTMPEGRVRRALEGHMEQARLSKWTAAIKVDVDVELPLEGARLFHYDEAAVRELFDRLEFRSLLPRLPGRAVDDGSAPAALAPASEPAPLPGDLQSPATDVEIVIDAHQAADAMQRIRAAGAIAVRTVVDGSPRTGDMIGVAFAPKGEDIAYYMPVWHAGLERNADPAAIVALEEVLADSTIPKRGYDLKRELLAWRRRGIAIQGLEFDAMLAAYLTNSRLKVPTLPVLAHDLALLSVEAEETLLGSGRGKRGIADVPVEEAAVYYGVWVGLLDPVGEKLIRDMERAHATRLHDTMELPLVPILAAMEVEGVAVDCDLLGAIR